MDMTKIIKQIPEHEVFNVVTRIHKNEDVDSGDLTDRIESNRFYNHVVDFEIDNLDLNQYSIDEDIVEDIIYEIQEKGLSTMPKIIIDSEKNIIDGLHRLNALKKIGINKIDLLIGTNEEYQQVFKKELIDEDLKIYKISNNFGSISIMEDAKYSPADNSVFEFIVDEKYRGLGVGTELLKEAMNQYDNLGAQVSSIASLKVFLECRFAPLNLDTKQKPDLDLTSYDFKVFNKDPELLNEQGAMYRRSIEIFQDRLNSSIQLFEKNDGSLYFSDPREKVKQEQKIELEKKQKNKYKL